MPKLVEMVPDTVESVIRPVVWDIVRDLMKVTGISDKTRIFFPGDSEVTFQKGSTIDDPNTNPHTTGDARLTIRVDEEFDQQQALAQAVYQAEQLFVWKDERINTYLKPSYGHTLVTLNFEYRAIDKTAALRWRDEMKTRLSMARDLYLHAVKYHFALPEVFVAILQELHRMREAVAGYGEDWATYFTTNASNRVSQISTLSGDRQLWAVAETQKRVQGRFTFDDTPERGEKNAEGETWNVSFQYKFELEKPLACVMSYPLVVHNQVVDRKYRPSKEDLVKRVEDTASSRSLSQAGFAGFEAGRWTDDRRLASAPGRSLPDFDEFIPNGVPVEAPIRLFTALTTIDTSAGGDPTCLLDLHQLSRNWNLDPGVLAYMAQVYPMLNVPGRCPLLVSVYENENLLSGRNVQVTADLKVHLLKAVDLRNVYHVRLGLVQGWCRLPSDSLEPLRQDADTLLKLLTAVDSRSTLNRVLSNGWVPQSALRAATDFLCQAEYAQGNGQDYPYCLVQTLFVVAERKE